MIGKLKPGPKPGSPRRADAKRPGPKPSGNAKTYAERCRSYRERKKLKNTAESSCPNVTKAGEANP